MNYSTFRNLWHKDLSEAGLLFFPPWPSERIDLRDMSRSYKIPILSAIGQFLRMAARVIAGMGRQSATFWTKPQAVRSRVAPSQAPANRICTLPWRML